MCVSIIAGISLSYLPFSFKHTHTDTHTLLHTHTHTHTHRPTHPHTHAHRRAHPHTDCSQRRSPPQSFAGQPLIWALSGSNSQLRVCLFIANIPPWSTETREQG